MTRDRKSLVVTLLRQHGRSFADELGFDLAKNSPSALFRLLCFALLASARISHEIAVGAARALSRERWNTAQKMAQATWRHRTDVLNRAGYARYDESTSRMLGETTRHLLDAYRGDLRRLREAANQDAPAERELLKAFKGIGDVGVDIFFREVQLVWEEVYPHADRGVLKAASKLGLGDDAKDLVRLVDNRGDFVRLTAALVRVELTNGYGELTSRDRATGA
ncbi:MAG: hypothetical protein ACR2KU_13745 [Gammaproteobacteria bacterium]